MMKIKIQLLMILAGMLFAFSSNSFAKTYEYGCYFNPLLAGSTTEMLTSVFSKPIEIKATIKDPVNSSETQEIKFNSPLTKESMVFDFYVSNIEESITKVILSTKDKSVEKTIFFAKGNLLADMLTGFGPKDAYILKILNENYNSIFNFEPILALETRLILMKKHGYDPFSNMSFESLIEATEKAVVAGDLVKGQLIGIVLTNNCYVK